MKMPNLVGYVLAGALFALATAAPALAGPEMTFGPEQEGLLRIDYKGQFQMTARDIGSGADDVANTYNFNFRRNRIALMGAYGDLLGLYVQTEFLEDPNVGTLGVAGTDQPSSFQMLDAAIRLNFRDEFKLWVGKLKYNLSRENLEACEDPLSLDRSLFVRAPYVGTRDYGVAMWGNLLADRFQYRLDMMEGRDAISGAAAPGSNARLGARGHVSLWDSEKEYGYKGTYLGKKKVLTIGGAAQYESNAVYANVADRDEAADYLGWTVDGFLEFPVEGMGTPTISGAYEEIDFDGAYLGVDPDPGVMGLNGEKRGWYVKAGYLLPKTPLQLFGRYEEWRFALLENVYDQTITWYGAGANFDIPDQRLKLTVEFSSTNFDKLGTFSGLQGDDLVTKDFNTVTAQLQVVF
jgi:hypothetical protein